MKGYKGFDKNMKCRGMQYEEGKTYTAEGEIKVCHNGLHACENPLDVLKYYSIAKGSKYHVVEYEGDISKKNGDSKIACRVLTVGAEISVKDIVKAGINMIFKKASLDNGDQYAQGDYSTAATQGDYSTAATQGCSSTAATQGYYSTAATQGYYSTAATQGDYSTAATQGDYSTAATQGYYSTAATQGCSSTAATQGYYSTAATQGYYSTAATQGDYSTAATQGCYSTAATQGYYSTAATQGDYSTAATQGCYSTAATQGDCSTAIASGVDSIALANGYRAKAKAVLGCYIVLTEYVDNRLKDCQCRKVDGEKIKADTWYVLKDGEFREKENNNAEN